jgi:hypothetical protein
MSTGLGGAHIAVRAKRFEEVLVNTALVTGSLDRIEVVAVALKQEGFDASGWKGPAAALGDRMAPGSVDCYVQLSPAPDAWSKACAGPLLAAPLVHRLETVAAVASLLAGDAAVVIVADEPGWDATHRRALQALAEAAVAERAGPGRRVTVVDGGDPDQIAAIARREWRQARAVSLADLAPGLPYADWRNEIMNLTSSAETTYFGWQRLDGARRTAVLRRSVLSPVHGGEDGGHGLARAVLTDALGSSTLIDLQAWDPDLVEDFFRDVIRPLPPEGFELPIHAVAAWVVRRSLSSAGAGRDRPSWSNRLPQPDLGTVPVGAGSGHDQAGG